MKIFDRTLSQLEDALDVRMARHNVLAGNLANADTPGYVARDVDFAAAMAAASSDGMPPAAGTEGHLPLATAGAGVETATVRAADAGAGFDGNAVDSDRTLVALAENGLQYGAAAKTAAKKLAILRYVASVGAA